MRCNFRCDAFAILGFHLELEVDGDSVFSNSLTRTGEQATDLSTLPLFNSCIFDSGKCSFLTRIQ